MDTHFDGRLLASNNDGSVYINGKRVVLKGSAALPDLAGHINPYAVGASPNVFACGGGGGGSGAGGAGGPGAGSGGGSAQPAPVDPGVKDVNSNSEGFCKGVDVYNQLIADGYSPAAAAGMVGNILHESDQFRADIEYGNGIGRGWLQWSYGRRDSFEEYAAANGLDPTTDAANYNYLQYELNGNDGNHWSKGYSLAEYKTIQDPAQAAEYFMRGYERPAEKTANLAARQENARKLMEGDHDCPVDGGMTGGGGGPVNGPQ
jgi:hypothetical protein